MKVLYSNEPAIGDDSHSIFLAGPTPRSRDVDSWRPEALEFLEVIGWNGLVMVPEHRDWSALASYDGQVEWEQVCLHGCGKVVFGFLVISKPCQPSLQMLNSGIGSHVIP